MPCRANGNTAGHQPKVKCHLLGLPVHHLNTQIYGSTYCFLTYSISKSVKKSDDQPTSTIVFELPRENQGWAQGGNKQLKEGNFTDFRDLSQTKNCPAQPVNHVRPTSCQPASQTEALETKPPTFALDLGGAVGAATWLRQPGDPSGHRL